MNRDKFLQLEGIHKTFQLPAGKESKAVVDVNVNIKKNEIDSIIPKGFSLDSSNGTIKFFVDILDLDSNF